MHQGVLIVSAILGCWLGMQAVHELGHVLGAWLTGGQVARVVLNPRTISPRTSPTGPPSPLGRRLGGPGHRRVVATGAVGRHGRPAMPRAFLVRFLRASASSPTERTSRAGFVRPRRRLRPDAAPRLRAVAACGCSGWSRSRPACGCGTAARASGLGAGGEKAGFSAGAAYASLVAAGGTAGSGAALVGEEICAASPNPAATVMELLGHPAGPGPHARGC